ncbi:uncharacterized protein LOC143600472 [Bidens hawaiensis]|uniref:uncharacterized protein LOC143600472 n=1 Tax=Bidens hawaiensis TaxID=980011 RepID=UPI00404A4278
MPLQRQLPHNGKEMKNFETPSSLGVTDGGLVMMVSNTSSMVSSNGVLNPDGSALNPAAYQQQIRNNSDLMAQLLQSDPELAQIITGNDLNKLQELLRRRHNQRTELRRLIEAEMALLYADPFDVEAQKKIEAAIRQKGIDENQAAALERVVMLYVDMEVNGVPVKAFVDTGAESTILSKSCAECLGLLRLLDERYKGIAHGVGQSEILGRIHVAEIKIGNNFYPCSFVVSDSPDMEFHFGLDMLRKHQCTIDLKDNVLRVGGGEVTVPFLPEKDIPCNFIEGEKQLNEASSSGTGGSFGSAAERSNTPGSDHGGLSHDHPSIIDPSNQPTSSALQIDMARGVCKIRGDDEYYEPDFLYSDTTRTMFTMKIFHGGEFSKYPGRAYKGGKVSYVDNVEVDKFDKDELGEIVRSVGYPCDMVLYFHYKEPCLCLDLGIKPLCDNGDFQKLFDIVRGGTNLVEVYIEHGQTCVITNASFSTYFPISNEGTLIKFTESRGNEEECSESDSYESDSEGSKDDDDDPDYIQEFNDNHVEDVDVDFDADEHKHEHKHEHDTLIDGGDLNDDTLNVDIDNFDSDDENPRLLKSVARKIRRKQVTSASETCPFYVGQLIETKEKLNEMVKKYAV